MNRQELITVLYEYGLGDIEPRKSFLGICDQILSNIAQSLEAETKNLFADWSEFSGEASYPVPSMRERMSAKGFYKESLNLWTGEYGAARRRLCVFLADRLTLNQEEAAK